MGKGEKEKKKKMFIYFYFFYCNSEASYIYAAKDTWLDSEDAKILCKLICTTSENCVT